jgi:shikimate dehydrogenase
MKPSDGSMPTPTYGVAGNPVAHSQSPFIHTEFAHQTGLVMRYERLLWPTHGFRAAAQAWGHSGGRGCNVTVPFKLEAAQMATVLSERAALAQAANVLIFRPEGWWADNTDGIGLVTDIERNAGVALAGRRVLLIGAGGAAAGVLGPLLAARPTELVVVNRSADKARTLVERHQFMAGLTRLSAGSLLEGPGVGFDVVINATTTSLQGRAVPVPSAALAPGALALDMMYGPSTHPFLSWAATHGAQGRDGLGMLVEQAAVAFKIWHGVQPDTAPVLHALRQRLNHAAAESGRHSE